LRVVSWFYFEVMFEFWGGSGFGEKREERNEKDTAKLK